MQKKHLFFDSRGRDVDFTTNNTILWVKSGAKLKDLIGDAKQIVLREKGNTCISQIYICGGINNMTKKLKGPHYEELVYNDNFHLQSVVDDIISFSKFMAVHGIKIVFATIAPMNLLTWNTCRKQQHKTTILKCLDNYQSMQRQLQQSVIELNNKIVEINRENRVVTPFLEKPIVQCVSRGRRRYYYHRLVDGLHATAETKHKWKNIISKTIEKNLIYK